jgi:hypothetical protein
VSLFLIEEPKKYESRVFARESKRRKLNGGGQESEDLRDSQSFLGNGRRIGKKPYGLLKSA